MPKIRRSRKKPPDGWELIEPTLEELEQKMREGKCFITIVFQTYEKRCFEVLFASSLDA